MRKAWLVIIMLVCAVGVSYAANKISAYGSPNVDGKYPVEIFDDRSTVIENLTADAVTVDRLTVDGTLYTAPLVVDGSIYLGRASLDPCATIGPGTIFINNTTGAPCFCNNLGVDLSLYNGTSACF